jgi:hypothetical protein
MLVKNEPWNEAGEEQRSDPLEQTLIDLFFEAYFVEDVTNAPGRRDTSLLILCYIDTLVDGEAVKFLYVCLSSAIETN